MQTKPHPTQQIDEASDYDPDWDNPVTLEVAPDLTWQLGVRLTRDELRILSAAAAKANLPINRYITQAALQAAQRTAG